MPSAEALRGCQSLVTVRSSDNVPTRPVSHFWLQPVVVRWHVGHAQQESVLDKHFFDGWCRWRRSSDDVRLLPKRSATVTSTSCHHGAGLPGSSPFHSGDIESYLMICFATVKSCLEKMRESLTCTRTSNDKNYKLAVAPRTCFLQRYEKKRERENLWFPSYLRSLCYP